MKQKIPRGPWLCHICRENINRGDSKGMDISATMDPDGRWCHTTCLAAHPGTQERVRLYLEDVLEEEAEIASFMGRYR